MQQSKLDRESLIAYRQRWEIVAAVEAAEREAGSIAERWRQMNALLRLAQSLGIVPPPEGASLNEVRRRWQTLAEADCSYQG